MDYLGQGPFAPVPPHSLCTTRYGGLATTQITGTWAERPADARYDRGDGSRTARRDDLVPLLPGIRSRAALHTARGRQESGGNRAVTGSASLPRATSLSSGAASWAAARRLPRVTRCEQVGKMACADCKMR